MRTNRPTDTRGFSLVEMMFVVTLIGIVGAMAVGMIGQSVPAFKGDGAMRVIMANLNRGRELAITQRRYMRVVFTNPNKVEIIREEVLPANTTTVISTMYIEGGMAYSLVVGVADTPDAFGKAAAIDFNGAASVKFNPDGMLVDTANSNNIKNGTVFLALLTNKMSVRAVTVLGSTGRVRGYKYDGARWKLV